MPIAQTALHADVTGWRRDLHANLELGYDVHLTAVRPENRRSFTAVAEAFFAAHLGGRFEPVDDDFKGSTIEFRAGRELISALD